MSKSEWVKGEIEKKNTLSIMKAVERGMECFKCGAVVKPGELFSRSSDKNGTMSGIRYIFCSACRPIKH